MKPETSLRRVVLNALIASTIFTGLVFIAVALATIHLVERQLASQDLGRDMERIFEEIQSDKAPSLERGMLLFSEPSSNPSKMSEELDTQASGLHFIEHQGDRYYALITQRHGTRHALLQERDGPLDRQRLNIVALGSGYLLSILAAWGIGYLLSRRIIAPVKKLAMQVSARANQRQTNAALADDYANDEIGQLAASFDRTMQAIDEAIERERLFTADVSHELRTPLMAMASSCELLLAGNQLVDEQKRVLKRLMENCARLEETIQTCLFLARDEAGQEQQKAPRPLTRIIETVISELQPLADSHTVTMHIEDHSQATKVTRAIMLELVVSNLIRNAITHSNSPKVNITLYPDRLTINDAGSGLPVATGTVLKPFYRGSETNGDGLGIGLSLVQRICQRQHWQLDIHSDSQGSCFTIHFAGNSSPAEQ